MSAPAKGVLSAIDAAIDRCNWAPHSDELLNVRDAVSELIEAAREYQSAVVAYDSLDAPGGRKFDAKCFAAERLTLALARCTKEEMK